MNKFNFPSYIWVEQIKFPTSNKKKNNEGILIIRLKVIEQLGIEVDSYMKLAQRAHSSKCQFLPPSFLYCIIS